MLRSFHFQENRYLIGVPETTEVVFAETNHHTFRSIERRTEGLDTHWIIGFVLLVDTTRVQKYFWFWTADIGEPVTEQDD